MSTTDTNLPIVFDELKQTMTDKINLLEIENAVLKNSLREKETKLNDSNNNVKRLNNKIHQLRNQLRMNSTYQESGQRLLASLDDYSINF